MKPNYLPEAVELLNDSKYNCFPDLQKRIESFAACPDKTLPQAIELLKEVKPNCGMFMKAEVEKLLSAVEGKHFNEKDFFYEKLPGEQ